MDSLTNILFESASTPRSSDNPQLSGDSCGADLRECSNDSVMPLSFDQISDGEYNRTVRRHPEAGPGFP